MNRILVHEGYFTESDKKMKEKNLLHLFLMGGNIISTRNQYPKVTKLRKLLKLFNLLLSPHLLPYLVCGSARILSMTNQILINIPSFV